ncbi:hypothetical protein [Acidovorax sp. K2F]|uniref:hypothetical protein n=1 Tax=Acidovorax sp. K2F TaxID=2978125 RepID=UPI0021B0DF0B|nr:hypothetical protein [Acidovorax sp. K2F]MCT6720034.1 hypothetical protein [Acidovorax sp. K2F]
MNTPASPIHWECYSKEPARVVDLRTLPEQVKVEIIKAALNVGFRVNNGQFDAVAEGSEEEEALNELAISVEAVREHMHAVNLMPCP